MRVTTASTYLTTARSLGSALSRTQELNSEISSGRRINRWSDDAPAASAAESYRNEEADYAAFQKSGEDAKGWLSAADGALQSMSSLMTHVKELAVTGQNGALSASGRAAIADEVQQMAGQLRDLAGTQHMGRPLFGGFSATAVAYTPSDDPDGGSTSWQGDGAAVQRRISPTVTLPVNVDGAALFGFDGSGPSVFDTLNALSASIRSGDLDGAATQQSALQGHMDAVGRGLSFVGATANRVDAVYDASEVAKVSLAERRSDLEEVDLADAVLQLNQAQAGYQAALGAAAKANLPTLADFLK